MRIRYVRLGLSLGCLLTASVAWAQDVKPATTTKDPADRRPGAGRPAIMNEDTAVHRLEVFNGPLRTVHYYTAGLSRADRGTMRDLERAENEIGLANQMLTLRHQYVADEVALQAQRRALQERLYSYSTTYATGIYPDEAIAVDLVNFQTLSRRDFDLFPHTFGGSGFSSLGSGALAMGGYPFPNGVPTPPANLAYGLDEGPLKSQMVRTLAGQATPEYTARITRDFDSALARASESSGLRTALFAKGESFSMVGHQTVVPVEVTATTRSGKIYKGMLVREDNDHLVIDTPNGETEIRKDATETVTRKTHKQTAEPPK